MKTLEVTLRSIRESGRKALVPYFVAGATPDWMQPRRSGGARRSRRHRDRDSFFRSHDGRRRDSRGRTSRPGTGTTFESICQELASLESEIPLIAMTYYNIFFTTGFVERAGRLHDVGSERRDRPGPLSRGVRRVACGVRRSATSRRFFWSPPRRRRRACARSRRYRKGSSTRRPAWR